MKMEADLLINNGSLAVPGQMFTISKYYILAKNSNRPLTFNRFG